MAQQQRSSARRKEGRAASRLRGKAGKAFRNAVEQDAHRTNKKTVADGGLTPWQQATAARAARRLAA